MRVPFFQRTFRVRHDQSRPRPRGLDVLGDWYPTLAFVMAGALLPMSIAWRIVRRRSRPALAATYAIPTRSDIDKRLVFGAALFGTDWGLAGLCPGPAIAAFPVAGPSDAFFLAAMICGMVVYGAFAGGQPLDRGFQTE